MKLSSKRIKRYGIPLAILFALTLGLWLARFKILQAAGDFLIVQDKLTRADAIVVLGGPDESRPQMAAKLYFRGYAPKIIATAGDSLPDYMIMFGKDLTASKLNYLWLTKRRNVPEEDVIIINQGTSTYEEALLIADYAKKEKLKKIIVVTSSYHTRRARWVFRKVLGPEGVEVLICPATHRSYVKEWWRNERFMIEVNNEYMKLIYYLLKGRL